MFEIDKQYTRELSTLPAAAANRHSCRRRTAGRGRLPAHGLNPHAPDVILCDGSASARAAGRTLAAQRDAIPVFIRIATDAYRFVGQYVVSESLTAPLDCAPYVRNSSFTPGQISRVLKLKRC